MCPTTGCCWLGSTTVHKPLAGHVTFFETGSRTARETLAWEAGECVGYHETFAAGNAGAGSLLTFNGNAR
ncbi:MAG: hypothetical protein M3Y54_15580 [Bacteroidota bacterium]|nr:hypothetical protein [Bacteroidota bacterium]